MVRTLSQDRLCQWVLFIALVLNLSLWFYARHEQSRWMNVPPVPRAETASFGALGDQQFSFRLIGVMLQNLGDFGGRVTPLHQYNYDALAQWFFLADVLDPQSNFVPFMAAYYFSNVQDKQKLRPLIHYLSTIGQRPGKQKWRWMAQAVYLARYDLKDMELALGIARKLAAVKDPDLPIWAQQMPALILNVQGDKEAAAAIVIENLKSNADKMHPSEVLFLLDLLCNRIFDKDAASHNTLCQSYYER